MSDLKAEPFFSAKAFGRGLNALRKNKGYKNTAEFAAAIEQTTGYPITGTIIYNVESGRKEVTEELLVAISLTLYGELRHPDIDNICELAIGEQWREFSEEQRRKRERWSHTADVVINGLTDGFEETALSYEYIGSLPKELSCELQREYVPSESKCFVKTTEQSKSFILVNRSSAHLWRVTNDGMIEDLGQMKSYSDSQTLAP